MSRHDRTRHPARTWSVACRALAFGLLLLVVAPGSSRIALAQEKVKKGDEGGKLSDAAKETAKPPDQQRTIHVDGNKSCDCGSTIGVWIGGSGGSYDPGAPVVSDDGSPGLTGHDVVRMLHVGAVVEAMSLSSPDFASATLYGLRVGISGHHRASLDLVFLGGPTPFTAGSDLAARFRKPGELALDGSVRCSITPPDAPLGIAPVLGFRAGWLTWSYLNGIWLERDGDVYPVSEDGVEHYSPYLGLAVTLMRTRHVELGVTGLVGWRHYASRTDMGLQNDLFGQDRFSELRLETRFGL